MTNKYNYLKVIQQHYGQGWEDVSEYEAKSNGTVTQMSGVFKTHSSGRKEELTLLSQDLKEYKLTGYQTRVIFRKERKA